MIYLSCGFQISVNSDEPFRNFISSRFGLLSWCECPSVRLSVCLSVRPSVRDFANCVYTFELIKDGLKIWFFQNPEIIFYHFFPIFNLDIFTDMYSQNNYAYCQNPEIIFYHFFRIFNLDIFRALILQNWRCTLYRQLLTVFCESFWNFQVF